MRRAVAMAAMGIALACAGGEVPLDIEMPDTRSCAQPVAAVRQPMMCVSPPAAPVAEPVALVFALQLPDAGLTAGGEVELELPASTEGRLEDLMMTPPQDRDPAALGWVDGCRSRDGRRCGAGAALVTRVDGRVVRFRSEVAAEGGEWLLMRVRARTRANAGRIAWKFRTDLDADGSPELDPERGFFRGPQFAFEPGAPAYVRLVAPADLGLGELFELEAAAHDALGNLARPSPLRVELAAGAGSAEGLALPLSFDGAATPRRELRAVEAGWLRVDGKASGGLPVYAHYSYVHAEPPALRRLFGDTHFHTGTITGHAWDAPLGGDHRGQYGDAQQAYAYAADVALLDFASLAEHDLGASAAGWQAAQAATEAFDARPDFTAFRAYERTDKRWNRGGSAHQVVLYRGERGGIVEPTGSGRRALAYPELVRQLEAQGEPFMLIPHPMGTEDVVGAAGHPIFAEGEIDERYARVSEFHSRHRLRSSDRRYSPWVWLRAPGAHTLEHAWGARGLQLGVVGSSDNHAQMPGAEAFGSHTLHAGSLAVALARDNSRDALWEALHARRTYGTTGPRIYLDLRVDSHVMGEHVEAQGPREISVRVAAPHALASVVLTRYAPGGGAQVELLREEAFPHLDRFERTHLIDADPLPPGESYYVLRTEQRPRKGALHGRVALASPIWVATGGGVSPAGVGSGTPETR